MKVKLSKMVTDRQRWFEKVSTYFERYAEEMVATLTAELAPGLKKGEPMPDILGYLRLQMSRLGRAVDRMLKADVSHINEQSFGAGRRQLRDELIRRLKKEIRDQRDVIRLLYRHLKDVELGFERRIAHRHLPLLRQAARILGNLRDPKIDLEPSSYKGTEVSRATLIKKIAPLAQALREAVDAVTIEEVTLIGTGIERKQAIESFDDLALQTMTNMASTFRQAGKDELAKLFKVLPRRSRRSQSAAEGGESPADAEAENPEASEPESRKTG